VLVLLLGRATRLARFLALSDKAYDARIRLGRATTTYDATGNEVPRAEVGLAGGVDPAAIAPEAIETALAGFRGTIRQAPPPYSAKKVGGVRAYALARRRQPVAPPAASVTAHALEVTGIDGTALSLGIVCSSGFYVRSLAHDLGIRLGCSAHLESLRRTRTGPFGVEHAVALERLEAEGLDAVARLIPMADLLPDLPAHVLTDRGARRAAHGNAVAAADVVETLPGPGTEGLVRLLDRHGALLAVAEPRTGQILHPVVVLV